MSKVKPSGFYPHLVISTRELQDPEKLVVYLSKNMDCIDYVVSVEYGQNGHPHIECFSQWSKSQRQDKFKEKILNLYGIVDVIEKKNVKVTFNHIDTNPLYGYGYSVKENPKVMYTSLPEEYLEDAKRYYEEHVDAVNNAKAVIKGKYKRMLTLDEVAEAYLEYCKTLGLTSMWKITHIQGSLNNYDRVDYFSEFMNSFDTMIPFSLYQKINEEKLTKWVDAYLRKVKDE